MEFSRNFEFCGVYKIKSVKFILDISATIVYNVSCRFERNLEADMAK